MSSAGSMRAAVFRGVRDIAVTEVARPTAEPGKVLVKVTRTGICTFERRIYSGAQKHVPMPSIAGHEVAATVEAAPADTGFEPGDRVALDLVYRCGHCYYCVRGQDNQCVRLYSEGLKWDGLNVIGGGFGEYISVDPAKVFKVDPTVPHHIIALSEPLGCVIHSFSKTTVGLGDTVAVIGAGTMGSLHVVLAKLYGCKVLVSDPDEERLAFVRDRLGADVTVNPTKDDPIAAARALSAGRGTNAVFVTAGVGAAAEQAIEMAGKYSTVVLYASTHPAAKIQVDWNRIHYNEIRIDGTESRTRNDVRTAAELLPQLQGRLEHLVSRQIALEELPDELEHGVPTGATQRVIVNLEA
ncbi:MAG: alcohol dehydrogenase catalytic domain-containing protein [Trueperaceae bacterium]|nr:alcohol dehydrogenase catalytic domain-containing protein [Trueperaceae bacterium]MCO5173068.1 alcohol dehydrogenase catalytic domain-containing protein [Trueperaceae bacterium]